MQPLDRYLEIEQILNRCFGLIDYCLTQCIEPERAANPSRAAVGCCVKSYYLEEGNTNPGLDALRIERERIYGLPDPKEDSPGQSPCKYHTAAGCRLQTHKSPTCLSFMCRESIEYLRREYRIFEYDYLGMYHALDWILSEDLVGAAFQGVKQMCLEMEKKIQACRRSDESATPLHTEQGVVK